MRGVQKCTRGCSTLRGRKRLPLCCIKLDTATDPCMGSGHILVYAFDVLMQIYESEGYNPRDAAKLVLEKNIYGLDIDRRAYQLAYFSLMMKARQYNRRIFTESVKPQVFHPVGFPDGEEYGSLVKVDVLPPQPVEKKGQLSLEDISNNFQLNAWNFKRLLSQKYDVVVTNPPYMGGKGQSAKTSEYLKANYPYTKSDTFSAFIERCGQMAKPTGYVGMFTPYVWMFIQSYEKLRNMLYQTKDIVTLIQFEYSAFEEATVPVCTFVLRNGKTGTTGEYLRLVDYRGGMEVQRVKTLEAIANQQCGYRYTATAESFLKIPGCPVAYWVGEKMLRAFEHPQLGELVPTKKGLDTGENDKFLRYWFEISRSIFGIGYANSKEFTTAKMKWAPHDKGGEFRRWYGNKEWVINWENNGFALRNSRANLRSEKLYFTNAITWSSLSSGKISFRFSDYGAISNTAGSSLYPTKEITYYYLGLLNTNVAQLLIDVISPTLNYSAGPISQTPIVVREDKKSAIDELVKANIAISRTDWDSFETSWDFSRHPLISGENTIESAITKWKNEAQERFDTLKANEEELNSIFINIYGLQDELTQDVEDKDVTVRRAVLGRDIRSLISYAVGCMFGRYSLDTEGLAYAGCDWDEVKYHSFIPDKDNILPICDDEYVDDDILARFVDFIRAVYGAETLEENLKFIADALGGKDTPRAVIRNYFLNDFFKDHLKIYQKRPIYWQFDSGKKNGFKALIYMHRYDENTIGNLRIDYLHKMQRIYENEIGRMQDAIENSKDAREVTAATKRKEKLVKQLQETKEYDEKIAHLALARTSIDLDDGVKVNYEKVQTDRDGKKHDVLAKI